MTDKQVEKILGRGGPKGGTMSAAFTDYSRYGFTVCYSVDSVDNRLVLRVKEVRFHKP
jgi:hypothetical protein